MEKMTAGVGKLSPTKRSLRAAVVRLLGLVKPPFVGRDPALGRKNGRMG
jgi:hypothetical protein